MRRPITIHRIAIAASLIVAVTRAHAQRGIDVQLFHPSLDSYGIFATERSETAQPWELGLKLFTDYAANPLRLAIGNGVMSPTPPMPTTILSRQIAVDFGMHLGLTRWLELALQVPISAEAYTAAYGTPANAGDMMLVNSGFFVADPRTNVPPPDASPLDVRVALKARAFSRAGFGLAFVALVTIPFGDARAFLGDSSFTFRPLAVLDFTRAGFSLALNVGAIVRQTTSVYDPYDQAAGAATPRLLIQVGDELTWSGGVAYRFLRWMGVAAEVNGLTPLGSIARDDTADVLAGLQFFPATGLSLSAGAGTNLFTSALRHDDFRVFVGITWARASTRVRSLADSDKDGILDDADQCPHEAEDKDGYQDDDGCPDPDNDRDGIPDTNDKCPDEPEDRDGFQDDDGCPEVDNDRDGIPDAADRCPNEPEDRDGFQDEDGCPDMDNDGDGIADGKDLCPNEPETFNGVDDHDGCPDSGGGIVAPGHPIVIGEVINFEPGSAQIPRHVEPMVEKIAERLLANPFVRRLRIEGHTDGSERKGKRSEQLAEQRAEAVRDALVRRGVDAARLQAVGYGDLRRIDPGHTPAAAARNRRVEFVVVEQ